MILLQCDVKHWSFVSPAAKFHLTGLVVKWEPSNINLESERKWYEGASILALIHIREHSHMTPDVFLGIFDLPTDPLNHLESIEKMKKFFF